MIHARRPTPRCFRVRAWCQHQRLKRLLPKPPTEVGQRSRVIIDALRSLRSLRLGLEVIGEDPTMAYLLGIDQGTTQTTAVVLDEHGRLVDSRSAQLPISFPRPGWVEQDPWALLRTVREAAGPLVAAYPIAAVGFDNQGETFLLW